MWQVELLPRPSGLVARTETILDVAVESIIREMAEDSGTMLKSASRKSPMERSSPSVVGIGVSLIV